VPSDVSTQAKFPPASHNPVRLIDARQLSTSQLSLYPSIDVRPPATSPPALRMRNGAAPTMPDSTLYIAAKWYFTYGMIRRMTTYVL